MKKRARTPIRPTREGRLLGAQAVVTGGSSGIGRGIALAFAAEGADVVVTYRRNREGADATVSRIERLGRRAWALRVDVAREAEARDLVARAYARLGRVDVWVNNAGADILTGSGRALSPSKKLDLVLAVDVKGTALCSWAIAERMKAHGGGVIINMSWDHALVGAPGVYAEVYAAAKGGVLAFSKSLARTYAPKVRVNTLAPGWIATAFGDGLPTKNRRTIAARTPLRRWGRPDDVANAAVFLASRESSFLTGATLLVGGGLVM